MTREAMLRAPANWNTTNPIQRLTRFHGNIDFLLMDVERERSFISRPAQKKR